MSTNANVGAKHKRQGGDKIHTNANVRAKHTPRWGQNAYKRQGGGETSTPGGGKIQKINAKVGAKQNADNWQDIFYEKCPQLNSKMRTKCQHTPRYAWAKRQHTPT